MKRLALVAALLPLACSSGSTGTGDPDAGPPATSAAFWGLKDDLCWHYVDADGLERYTIGVEEDAKAVPGITTFHLEHRFQGLEVESVWVQVKDERLLLHRRKLHPIGEPETLYRYDPPVVYLEKGMETGDSRTVASKASKSVSNQPTVQEDLEVTVSAIGTEPVTALGTPLDAQKLNLVTNYPDSTTRADRIWFVAEKGIVKYDPQGDYDPSPDPQHEEIFVLKTIEALVAGAPCQTQ